MRKYRTRIAGLALAAFLGAASYAAAFRPVGWVYHQWPYLYAMNGGGWYYADPATFLWTYDTVGGIWQALGDGATAAGWVYYQWPYGYVHNAGKWYYMDEAGVLWCYGFTTGAWSRFGGLPNGGWYEWSPMPDYQRQIISDPLLGQHEFSVWIDGYGWMRFLLHVPSDYGTRTAWPVILFLHGSGEIGSNSDVLRTLGPSGYAEGLATFPFIVITPQLDAFQWWDPAQLDQLLNHVVRYYRVDQDRVSVTGMSLGGYGTWSMAIAYPNRFATAAPVAGGGDPADVCAIAHLPVWVFHGAKDTAVPLREAQRMVDSLTACGGNVQFTVYPDVGHNSWNPTYVNTNLYDWMASQIRIDP